MTTIRLHTALACALLSLLLGPAISAQTTASPQPIPETTPEPAPPVERDTSREREYRYFRPVIRIAQDFTLSAGEVAGEVQAVFSDVVIEGRVDRDLLVVMGSVRLASTAVVDGTVAVIGGSATIDENAIVRDDLVVIGGTMKAPPSFSPGGQHIVIGSPWMGETLQGAVPWITRGLLWGRLIVPSIEWIWGIVAVFFLIYLALNTIFDRPVSSSAELMVRRPLSAFMTGLLVLLLTGPVLAIVAASVIGLVVVPFILCAVIVCGLVGKASVARAIGRSLLGSEAPEPRFQATVAFVIGFALLTLAYMVPVLGFMTWALTTVIGLGAATMTFRSLMRRERPPTVPQVPAQAPAPSPAPVAGASYAPAAPAVGFASPTIDAPAPPVIPPSSAPVAQVYADGLAQYPRASFLDRLAAFTLDCILVAIANAILDMNRNDGFFFLLLLIYHVAFWAWKGTTLGGIICNLRVIRTHGAELRPPDAIVRGLSSVFSIAALGIGCLWMLQDPERQMWHDKIAGTLVVKVPKDLVLP